MFVKKSKTEKLAKNIEVLNGLIQKSNLVELSYVLGNRKEILIRNITAGIWRGIGIGIGITIITAILIIVLQNIVKLNIPVIGDYIADIVEIVKRKLY